MEKKNLLIERLVTSAARTLWVLAWTDWTEEYAPERIKAGAELFGIAPETPESAEAKGRQMLYAIADLNKAGLGRDKPESVLKVLFLRAVLADHREGNLDFPAVVARLRPMRGASAADAATEKYMDRFGHYLVMQAVGHGVSWFDDHAEFQIVVGNHEQPDISDFFDSVEAWGESSYADSERKRHHERRGYDADEE
jgi:hypothetical protein